MKSNFKLQIYIYIYIYIYGDYCSIPSKDIPMTQKMNVVFCIVWYKASHQERRRLNENFLNTQNYKVRIKVKVEQTRERNSLPLHLYAVAIKKEAFGSLSTTVTNIYIYIYIITSTRAGYKRRLVLAEFDKFEFWVFPLLDWYLY